MSQNAVEEILAQVDIRALADQLGTDPDTARQAAETAIPTLLDSLRANAATPDGQQSLLGALGQHSGEINDLGSVDTDDGRKILGHLFADDPKRIQGLAGQSGDLLSKLLPILAPLVMNWLARRVLGGTASSQAPGDGGLGGLLGGLFGGGAAGAGGGGLGDLLGQILGGLGGSQLPAGQAPSPSYPGSQPAPGEWPTAADRSSEGGNPLGDLLGRILGR